MKRIKVVRRYTQLITAVLYNCGFSGWADGRIRRVSTKGLCVPGLNCYSCPSAVAACPLGSLQSALQQSSYALPWYLFGTLILLGVLLGRVICGFLCPFGWLQELLYRIPTPKLKKSPVTRVLSLLKYAVLAVTLILPVFVNAPVFCKYLCPAGTLEAGIPLTAMRPDLAELAGGLFSWKVAVLAACIIAFVFVFRAFCRFLCPLGAFYSLFNRIAFAGMKVERGKCVDCGKCVRVCRMDIRRVGDRECISCTACMDECPTGAITFGVRGKASIRPELLGSPPKNAKHH